MISTVPAETLVTTPVVNPTVAMPVAPLLQVPPGVASPKIVADPSQIDAIPVMGAAAGITFISKVTGHPDGSV